MQRRLGTPTEHLQLCAADLDASPRLEFLGPLAHGDGRLELAARGRWETTTERRERAHKGGEAGPARCSCADLRQPRDLLVAACPGRELPAAVAAQPVQAGLGLPLRLLHGGAPVVPPRRPHDGHGHARGHGDPLRPTGIVADRADAWAARRLAHSGFAERFLSACAHHGFCVEREVLALFPSPAVYRPALLGASRLLFGLRRALRDG
mmetsp:Transcript_36048/g.103603  ORF Transcript_36048/g.103603 Transcript_36048/m.103603 type:complete len:208 (+) Transcript_36048:1027-1650(+)